uniref:beta-galactosidase n=1 Tax=Kalmanozyma brasiliensis (strain GHG001) TaxID=1365824 RepID=V5ESD8_KALBG
MYSGGPGEHARARVEKLDAAARPKWTLPRSSNSSAVVFDKYSLALAGGQQRLFVLAGEFHPWRLPVPSLWRDVLQKIRAAGFNTVSIYTHWGLIQPSPDPASIKLTGVNDLDFFLTLAKEVGLFVIVRPGPYINAETTAGGMAPWTVNLDATLRTNDTAWHAAWRPYIDAISQVVVKHQLRTHSGRLEGGSVILVQADNEYKTGPAERAYMRQLVSRLKSNGITVPITYNDPGRDANFVDLVDLYGLDSYPQRFDCSNPTTWVPIRDDYLEYHQQTNPSQPFYIPEFQGGSYDPYGGPGYEQCAQMTNASWTRIANLALVAQRVTLLSIYMVYGGTNWGGLAEPDVYTSYDYGAALNEHRQITDKYTELKRQGYFVDAFADLAMTEQIKDRTGFNISQAWDVDRNKEVDARVFRTTVLENPETRSKFYVVRYDNTTESRRVSFALEIESLGESVLIGGRREGDSSVNHLNGRESHIIPVDQALPGGLLLRFSTANVYRVVTVGNSVVISLDYGPDQLIEYSLRVQMEGDAFVEMQMLNVGKAGMLQTVEGGEWEELKRLHSDIGPNAVEARGTLPVSTTDDHRFVTYKTALGTYVVMHFTPTFLTRRDFSAPARYIGSSPPSSLQRPTRPNIINDFFGLSEDSVVILNADLLRNATYSTTSQPLDTLHLWGSLTTASNTTAIFALPNLTHVYWNGHRVDAQAQSNADWLYILHLPGPSPSALAWRPPASAKLDWRWRDSIVQTSRVFHDAHWVDANKTTSPNPYTRDPSLDTQGTILFASEYGYHANNIVWRGRFEVDPRHVPTDVFVKVEGGRSSAFSVWLNDVYLGSAEAGREASAVGATFRLPASSLNQNKRGGKNVLVVLQDHMGIEMEAGQLPIGLQRHGLEAVKLPRGIVGFSFPSLRTTHQPEPSVRWKVQGNHMGESAPDTVRTSLNEGGLYHELQGWHLPGYNSDHWPTLPSNRRVVFYRTTFAFDAPPDADIGVSFVFRKLEGRRFRAQLYVNGWQMGRYVNNLGPQTVFPVHDGVLDLRGENVVGVSVWWLDDEEGEWDPREDLEMRVDHVMSGRARDGYVMQAGGWEELRG